MVRVSTSPTEIVQNLVKLGFARLTIEKNFSKFSKKISTIRKLIKFCILHARLSVIGLFSNYFNIRSNMGRLCLGSLDAFKFTFQHVIVNLRIPSLFYFWLNGLYNRPLKSLITSGYYDFLCKLFEKIDFHR